MHRQMTQEVEIDPIGFRHRFIGNFELRPAESYDVSTANHFKGQLTASFYIPPELVKECHELFGSLGDDMKALGRYVIKFFTSIEEAMKWQLEGEYAVQFCKRQPKPAASDAPTPPPAPPPPLPSSREAPEPQDHSSVDIDALLNSQRQSQLRELTFKEFLDQAGPFTGQSSKYYDVSGNSTNTGGGKLFRVRMLESVSHKRGTKDGGFESEVEASHCVDCLLLDELAANILSNKTHFAHLLKTFLGKINHPLSRYASGARLPRELTPAARVLVAYLLDQTHSLAGSGAELSSDTRAFLEIFAQREQASSAALLNNDNDKARNMAAFKAFLPSFLNDRVNLLTRTLSSTTASASSRTKKVCLDPIQRFYSRARRQVYQAFMGGHHRTNLELIRRGEQPIPFEMSTVRLDGGDPDLLTIFVCLEAKRKGIISLGKTSEQDLESIHIDHVMTILHGLDTDTFKREGRYDFNKVGNLEMIPKVANLQKGGGPFTIVNNVNLPGMEEGTALIVDHFSRSISPANEHLEFTALKARVYKRQSIWETFVKKSRAATPQFACQYDIVFTYLYAVKTIFGPLHAVVALAVSLGGVPKTSKDLRLHGLLGRPVVNHKVECRLPLSVGGLFMRARDCFVSDGAEAQLQIEIEDEEYAAEIQDETETVYESTPNAPPDNEDTGFTDQLNSFMVDTNKTSSYGLEYLLNYEDENDLDLEQAATDVPEPVAMHLIAALITVACVNSETLCLTDSCIGNAYMKLFGARTGLGKVPIRTPELDKSVTSISVEQAEKAVQCVLKALHKSTVFDAQENGVALVEQYIKSEALPEVVAARLRRVAVECVNAIRDDGQSTTSKRLFTTSSYSCLAESFGFDFKKVAPPRVTTSATSPLAAR